MTEYSSATKGSRKAYYAERVAAFMATIILIRTLYFKFTSDSGSIYIFT